MAKDILVNTQSGDFIVSEDMPQTSYWDVVWGKITDSDKSEYMNIVVPSGYINSVQLKNNKFECYAKAEYYPVNSEFLVRLVVLNVATNEYVPIQNYGVNAPLPSGAEYYPSYTAKSQNVMACQLPMIDSDGQFKISFSQYAKTGVAYATICSAKGVDFSIGDSDSQSAQLLARCAPGKYYRYPTTGLDLTKYINSVVEHTDMVDSLVSQFKSDSKQISEAEFDSSTGDLQVAFIGTKEAEDNNLIDPSLLNVELFRIADDDFVRTIYKNTHAATSNAGFIEGLMGGSFFGLYDIGCAAELDKNVQDISIADGGLDGSGNLATSSNGAKIATMQLIAGKIYAADYGSEICTKDGDEWRTDVLFAIYTDDMEELVYLDEPFSTSSFLEYDAFVNSFKNRRCFIPLENLRIRYRVWDAADGKTKYGIYPLVDESSNYNSILGIAINDANGKLTAITSVQSNIENVKIDVKTNQILVIK